MVTIAFAAGQDAHRAGLARDANPHRCGTTKLGAPKLTEAGLEWDAGWVSCVRRIASKEEVAAANAVNVRQFKRKSNRYYGGR